MSRLISFAILVTVILITGGLFILVMAQFLLPLFMAVLLLVLFRPMFEWFWRKTHGRAHLAAGLTTAVIVLAVLIPMSFVLVKATAQGFQMANSIDPETLRQKLQVKGGAWADQARESAAAIGFKIPSNKELTQTLVNDVQTWIAPAAWRTTQFVGSVLFNLAIMLVALYFFFADGPAMVRATMQLIPLDKGSQQQMLDQFVNVSRAVVMATLLTAIVQGVLAGVGYAFVGLSNVVLLSVMTMMFSMVPVVGAASVWGSCALWLYFIDGNLSGAIKLALWGVLVVSMIENLIRPWVLRGQSNLHPLLALLSVLGGVDALGPIGILVGPMVVSFLQALLTMLRVELDTMEKKGSAPKLAKEKGKRKS